MIKQKTVRNQFTTNLSLIKSSFSQLITLVHDSDTFCWSVFVFLGIVAAMRICSGSEEYEQNIRDLGRNCSAQDASIILSSFYIMLCRISNACVLGYMNSFTCPRCSEQPCIRHVTPPRSVADTRTGMLMASLAMILVCPFSSVVRLEGLILQSIQQSSPLLFRSAPDSLELGVPKSKSPMVTCRLDLYK
jgi:hypothetical protein